VLYLTKNLVAKQPLDQTESKIVIFLIIAFALAFLVSKGITIMNISGQAIYRELRIIQVFGGILFSTISGYALYQILKHFKGNKTNRKHALAVGLGFLIFTGSGSTLLSGVFWSNTGMGTSPTDSKEVEALDFLKRAVNASDVVLTYSVESNKKVGLTGATTIMRFGVPFSSTSPSIPKDFLQIVNYIYLTKQEISVIQESDTYMKALLSLMPIIFNNSEITIYSISLIRNYMNTLQVPVVIIGELKDALPKLAILDCLGLSYRIYDQWDTGVLETKDTIILTEDIRTASEAKNTWTGFKTEDI